MKRTYFAILFAALALTACSALGAGPPIDELSAANKGTATSLRAGGGDAESEQSDKHMNLGGSYLGDNKQSTAQVYGARKSSTPAWGGTLQAGVIQAGAATLKEMKETLSQAVKDDPVLVGLVKRRDLLMAQMDALVAADPASDTSAIEARIDLLTPQFEVAMKRIHETMQIASGGDFSGLKAIIIGSLQNNGNRVGADSLPSSPEEFEAYGEGFKALPALVEALMKSE